MAEAPLLAKVRRATTSSTWASERRNAAIIEAARAHSLSEVAAAAGLSKARVAQIVTAGREDE